MINNSLSKSRHFLELYSKTKSLCTIDQTRPKPLIQLN